MLLKLVHKIERERMLSNTFYEVNITLIAKLDKKIQRTTKKKPEKIIDQFPGITLLKIFSEHICKLNLTSY
jgi:hypothetical protein